MPIYRRLPKRGFTNPTRVEFAEVNVGRLQAAIEAGRLDAGKTDRRRGADRGRTRAPVARRASACLGTARSPRRSRSRSPAPRKGAVAAVEQAGGKVVVLGAPAEA